MSKLLKKAKSRDFIEDISKAYQILSKQEKLYFITLTGIPTSHIQDLNFQLTNRFFNVIHKDYKKTNEFINYLFIIEYGSIISRGIQFETFIRNLGIHAHCIINTSLSKEQMEFYINTSFKKIPNYEIQDISKSQTKDSLLNYLLKQNKSNLLSNESYNYKISI